MPDLLHNTLAAHFGHRQFRHPQEDVMRSILSGRDILVIMPTGGGKSLCYQLPALLLEGVTLVVSPLIALMKDQVDALRGKGIAAGMINSAQSWEEQRVVLDDMQRGRCKLVYVAPERFRMASFVRSLQGAPIGMLAIDEAHCISQWGHDFRPDYQRLGEARAALGNPLCSAFTATATPDVRRDIQVQLGLREPTIFISGFARPNLSFGIREIRRKVDKFLRIKEIIKSNQTGIIYCATRKSVEAVSEWMNAEGFDHVSYHAGLPPALREAAQNAFIRREVPVAVATSAFGMGIDRADLRFVCHYEMPGSVEAFYQEAGRAGRDGAPANCELLFMYADKRVQEFFVDGANPEPSTIRALYQFILSRANEQAEIYLPVDEIAEAMEGKTNPMAIQTAFGHLVRRGYLERFDLPGENIRGTRLLKPEIGPQDLELPAEDLAEKRRRDLAKLDAVVKMAYAPGCRQTWILHYFGESIKKDCGRCDSCRRRQTARPLEAEEDVLIVQKALSGVARMSDRRSRYCWEPRFGRGLVLQCLMGVPDERLERLGLTRLSTFGILQKEENTFVTRLLDTLVEAQLLEIREGTYPLLGLTESGARVMFGEEAPVLTLPVRESASSLVPGKRSSGKSGSSHPELADPEMFERLKKLRDQIRRTRNVPAYTIFPDKVLKHLANDKPRTTEEALKIPGIGPLKAAKELPPFLELLRGA